jgi:hypothetical protein
MLAETVPSCKLKETNKQVSINEYDSIQEVEWDIPTPNKFGYTNRHTSLATTYLCAQKEYLENLN